MRWLFAAWVILSLLYWTITLGRFVLMRRRVPFLTDLAAQPTGDWPRLSLVIPAKDESDRIEAALRSRLQDGYPNLEIIVIDDRSTDSTGTIADRIATEDGRVRVDHVRTLPDGWIGKVHALHRGARAASGDWLLLSDADVHVSPGTLARAVAFCIRRELDFFTVLPEIWRSGFVLDAFMAVGYRLVCRLTRVWETADPLARGAIGIGAFNLVRRAALDKAGGFEPLRLTVVDDVGLARLLKDSGAASFVANGRGLVGLRFYHRLGEAFRGLEKSALAGAGFSMWRLSTACAMLLFLELGAFAGLLSPGTPLFLLALAGVVFSFIATATFASWLGLRIAPAVCVPLGTVLLSAAALRAGWLGVRRNGLMWRNTLYPLSLLRAHGRDPFASAPPAELAVTPAATIEKAM